MVDVKKSNFSCQSQKIKAINDVNSLMLSLRRLYEFSDGTSSESSISFASIVDSFSRYFLRIRCYLHSNTEIQEYCLQHIVDYLGKNKSFNHSGLALNIANLIHVLDQSSQQIFLKRIFDIRSDSLKYFFDDLSQFLNLPSALLPAASSTQNLSNNSLASSSENLSLDIPTLDQIASLQSSRVSRNLLADLRRLSCTNRNHSNDPSVHYNAKALSLRKANDLINTNDINTAKNCFVILCLTAKFYLKRSDSLVIWKMIKPVCSKISNEAELVFMAHARLNHMLASKISRNTDTDIVDFYNPLKNKSLHLFYRELLAKRINSLNKTSICTNLHASIAIVVAVTDDRRNQELFLSSILSICLQTMPPKEVYVFVDPVFSDSDYSKGLINNLVNKNFDFFIQLNETCRNILNSIDFIVEVNSFVRGQYYARNQAIANTCCKYVAIQDDDDLSDKNRLKFQFELISKGGLLVYNKHLRISTLGYYQHDSREYNFLGDGIATLFTYTDVVKRHPFLYVKSRADVEFRERIRQIYGNSSIVTSDKLSLLMRGASDTVSSKFEHEHKKAFESFYLSIKNNCFY